MPLCISTTALHVYGVIKVSAFDDELISSLMFQFHLLIALLLNFLPGVAAQGLFLTPIDTATFTLYIALAALTFFQALRASLILCRPGDTGDRLTQDRGPYAKIFLATISLLACYILLAIWIPIALSSYSIDSRDYRIFYAMAAMDQLSDVFIAAAILHFIDSRSGALRRSYSDAESLNCKSLVNLKKKGIFDKLLLSFMALVIFVGAVVNGILQPDLDVTYMSYAVFYQAYIVLYIVATMDVTLSALYFWNALPKSFASTESVGPLCTHSTPN
ncbi:hypothetical protein H0H81_007156 [Sphagnurus paluster]|uniref:Uncharacterized protein n=1 Tax=Sphagnurus paluster TaxID=117069 RepID=A0A9P7FSX2_9AGAR|nr:hypothetical protein H0H81_007156 [Sphagnurus paluster]